MSTSGKRRSCQGRAERERQAAGLPRGSGFGLAPSGSVVNEAGARAIREPEDQFYGERSGGVADPAGNQWWISTHVEDVSEEEMARRHEEQSNKAGAGG